MKQSDINSTLLNVRLARSEEAQQSHIMLGILQLLYVIAERLDAFEEEEEDEL